MYSVCNIRIIFFFNDTATTEIYTLSLHDALPIWPVHDGQQPERRVGHVQHAGLIEARAAAGRAPRIDDQRADERPGRDELPVDRKSTRLNSSHANISYAVFCLKKKNKSKYYL